MTDIYAGGALTLGGGATAQCDSQLDPTVATTPHARATLADYDEACQRWQAESGD